MSIRIQQLYQEMILEHNRNPRNFKKLEDFTHCAHGANPLCGDDYWLFMKIKENRIEEIGFYGEGCAISKSSGSLLTQKIQGLTTQESEKIKDLFIRLLSSEEQLQDKEKQQLGSLKVFEGVKKFPIRVKCATLIWRTIERALNQSESGDVSTE